MAVTPFTVYNTASGDIDIPSVDLSQRKAAQLRITKGSYATTYELTYRALVARANGNATVYPTTFTVNNQFSSAPVDGTTTNTYVGQGNKIYNVTTYAIAQQNDSVLAQNLIQAQQDITSLRLLVNSLFFKIYGNAPVGN